MCAFLDGIETEVGTRPGWLRIERGNDHAAEFDAEGRLVRRQHRGESWRITLDWRVLRTRRDAGRLRRLPPLDEVWITLAEESERAARLAHTSQNIPSELRAWLARAGRFDTQTLAQDRRSLREIYHPIPVLPPDQYQSLVVQITEGCPWDRCSFCNFYRGQRHHIRSDPEFAAHFHRLLDHLGQSVERCSRVFLGQANAMLAPPSLLRQRLDSIIERLGLLPPTLPPSQRRPWRRAHPTAIDSIHSFIDAFHRTPSTADLRSYAERGLERLYLGLESGSPRVLELLQKPSEPEGIQALADAIHDAGLQLGVIVLVGAGGRTWREDHFRQTVRQIEALRLQRKDQVYLSRLVVHDGSDYARRAEAEGLEALDSRELQEAEHELRAALRSRLAAGVVIAPYDLEQISMWTPRA